ncbi:hypothetical protein K458DRAFT_384839 [Lentithecium fluviatile CBS 122367]|uniref:Uncharacterized protein n=1 Tax=Lentithecium fluviatile CBS 122367 TaxID=1168545 RepID=A0A6G1JDZ6_9PLEO|nr:hypothetical protein K458DRAFT_384839 [Lentithecium fluviatile CBS 122367]
MVETRSLRSNVRIATVRTTTAARNIDLVRPPPPCGSSITTSLPPDVASSRKTRINNDLLAYFHRRVPPHPATPCPIKGIGVYIHIEVPHTPQHPLFPHERFTQPPPPTIEFLPVGGPGRIHRYGNLKADLPDDVAMLYEEVRRVVNWEEMETKKEGEPDPRDKFEGLGLPDMMVPSPPPLPTPPPPRDEGSEEMDIDEDSDGVGDAGGAGSGRRASVGGTAAERRGRGSSERRQSMPDVSMGGTGAEAAKGTRSASTSAAKNAETTPNATTRGTIYDPSRDPRRRGR